MENAANLGMRMEGAKGEPGAGTSELGVSARGGGACIGKQKQADF